MPSSAVLPSGAPNADLLGGETIVHMDFLLPPAQPSAKPPPSPAERKQDLQTEGPASTGLGSPAESSHLPLSSHDAHTHGSFSECRWTTPGRSRAPSVEVFPSRSISPPPAQGSMRIGGAKRQLTPPRGLTLNFQVAPPSLSQNEIGKSALMQTGSTGIVSQLQDSMLSSTNTWTTTPRAAAASSPFLSSANLLRGLSQTHGVSSAGYASPGPRASPTSGMPLWIVASPQRAVSPSRAVSPFRGPSPARGRSPTGLVGRPGPARYPRGVANGDQRSPSPHIHSQPGVVRMSSVQQPQENCVAGAAGAVGATGVAVVAGTTPQLLSSGSHMSNAGISPVPSFHQLIPAPAADPPVLTEAAAGNAADGFAEPVGSAGAREEMAPRGHPLDHRLWEAEQLLHQHIAEVRARFDRNVRAPLQNHREKATRAVNHTVNTAWNVDQKLAQRVRDVHGNVNDVLKYTGLDQGMNHVGTSMAQKLDRHVSVTQAKIENRLQSPEAKKAEMIKRERKAMAAAQLQKAREYAERLEEEHWRVEADLERAKADLNKCHQEEMLENDLGHRLFKAADENVVRPFWATVHNIDKHVGRSLHSARESIDKSLERTGFHNGVSEGMTAMVQHFENVLARSLSPPRRTKSTP